MKKAKAFAIRIIRHFFLICYRSKLYLRRPSAIWVLAFFPNGICFGT